MFVGHVTRRVRWGIGDAGVTQATGDKWVVLVHDAGDPRDRDECPGKSDDRKEWWDGDDALTLSCASRGL